MIIRWGSITLYIEDAYFARGFNHGRELYARDCQLIPARKVRLNITEILRYVGVPNERTGHWYFDQYGQEHMEEFIGVFLGYLSGAIPDTSR